MIDLRLVLPALAAWLASAAALLGLSQVSSPQTRHSAALAVCAASIAIAIAGLIALRKRPSAIVCLAAGCLAALSAAAQVAAWTAPMFLDAMGQPVLVRAQVDGPLRTVVGTGYLPVRTQAIEDRASGEPAAATAVDVPITLTLPEHELAELAELGSSPWPVGSIIDVDGAIRPAGGSIRTAGYLDVPDPSAIALIAEPGPVHRLAERMRAALRASLPAAPAGGSALVAGLAIGDEQAMAPTLVDDMRASGLAHLTAVSGGNVAIVVGSVLALAWLLRLSMPLRIAISLAALAFYVVLVHPQPSVLRAGVMGAVVVVSLLIGGRRPGPSVLATAVIVLVVTVPSLALSWGFALSVAATGGIVMLAPLLRERIDDTRWGERLPAPVVIAASLTLAAQLATAPVLVAMGVGVGVAAVPANLLAMPVVPAVTIAGLLAAIVGSVGLLAPLASAIAFAGAWIAEWIAQIARIAGGVDVLRFQGSPLLAGLAVLAVIVAVLAWRRGHRAIVSMVAIVVAVAALLFSLLPPNGRSWPPPDWLLAQCDVGQGDGLVIAGTGGGGGAVVVDTGPSARTIDRCLDALGVEHVAALILTHFHADHVAGIEGVLSGRRVDAVFASPWDEPHAQSHGVRRALSGRGIALRRLTAGAHLRVGTGEYRVIWPRRIITGSRLSSGSVANNASVVIDARVHGLRVLLTGDIEPPAQAAVLTELGGFDIVKIPHHGSRHQHPDFAEWADAAAAIVSVGADNEFGHPAPGTLEVWRASGALVLRTDVHGDVAIVRAADPTGHAWGITPRSGSVESLECGVPC